MKGSNEYRIEDLIEQIVEVQKMVDLHRSGDDSFMVEQYLYRRNGFVIQLIGELLKLDVGTRDVMRAIRSCVKILEKDAKMNRKADGTIGKIDVQSLEAIA